jgi:hypothetical protein
VAAEGLREASHDGSVLTESVNFLHPLDVGSRPKFTRIVGELPHTPDNLRP